MYSFNNETSLRFMRTALDFIQRMEADTVAGPVMSGAVMASAIGALALTEGTPITALLLGKDPKLYMKSKHITSPKLMFEHTDYPSRVVLVDDCISSGSTMLYAISELRDRWPKAEITAVIVSGSLWNEGADRIRAEAGRAVIGRWDSKANVIREIG